MKKYIAAAILALTATVAYASCVTNTYITDGRVIVCTTCCYGTNCTTTCN